MCWFVCRKGAAFRWGRGGAHGRPWELFDGTQPMVLTYARGFTEFSIEIKEIVEAMHNCDVLLIGSTSYGE